MTTLPRKLLAKSLARLMPYSGKAYAWQRVACLSVCGDDADAPSLVIEAQNGVDFAMVALPMPPGLDREASPIAVPLELLRSVVAASDAEEVEIAWDDAALTVSDPRSRTRLLADKSDRPAFPRPGGVASEMVASGSRDLCDAIGAAAASAAPTDSRYAISAILVGGGKVVSTDGRLMQAISAGTGAGEGTILVPARLAAEIARWHAVDLFRGQSHAYAMCDGDEGVWLVGTAATEHVFPPWESVMPQGTPPTLVEGDADGIAAAIAAASTMCEEASPGVALSVSGERVELAARGFAGESKVVAQARGSGIGLVGLNGAQAVRLIKASGAIEDGPLEIRFSEPNRPIVYRRGERWTAVQMPTVMA
jgi:hypothetical protein